MFKEITIKQDGIKLQGNLTKVDRAKAWIIFAHGSGSSRKSHRNNWVAQELNKEGFSTLLFDLLTQEEDQVFHNRFDIPLLADRLKIATEWLVNFSDYQGEKIGYFGASTGAAAALLAARTMPLYWPLYAVVSRGGRPDLLKKEILHEVNLPVLLIVGSHDDDVLMLNEWAYSQLPNGKVALVPGALAEVVRLSSYWFTTRLDQSLSESRSAL